MKHPDTGDELVCLELAGVKAMVVGPGIASRPIRTECTAAELWVPGPVIEKAIRRFCDELKIPLDPKEQEGLARLGSMGSGGGGVKPPTTTDAAAAFHAGAVAMKAAIATAKYDAIKDQRTLDEFQVNAVPLPRMGQPAPAAPAPAASHLSPCAKRPRCVGAAWVNDAYGRLCCGHCGGGL